MDNRLPSMDLRAVPTSGSFSDRRNHYYTDRNHTSYGMQNHGRFSEGVMNKYPGSGFREDRAIYKHPNHELGVYPYRKRMLVTPFQQNFPHSFNKSAMRERIASLKKSRQQSQTERIVIKAKGKCPEEEILPVEDHQPEQSDEKKIKAEERVSDSDPISDTSELYILKYCLDRKTQRIICRLQNDFRLTNKYITFMMYEKPVIADFRPTPANTTNTFHNRFKCLLKGLLNEKDVSIQNVDLTSDLEGATEKPEVLENLTAEVPNELCNS